MSGTYVSAVDWCWSTRWAECKDRDKSRARALACFPLLISAAVAFSPAEAYALRDRLKGRGLSPGTVNRHLAAYLAVWGAYLQFPGRTGNQEAPPGGLYLREPAGRSRVVTPLELERLVAEMPQSCGALARFLYGTGCRVSEALGLRCCNVDANNGVWSVTFQGTKNGDDRTVPLDDRAQMVLETRHAPGILLANRSVFLSPTQSTFNHDWAAARARIGLEHDEGFVPHALRHTAITRWVAAGVPLPVVAKLAGHRSIKTTLRYTHLNTQNLVDAMSRAGIL